MQHVHHLRSWTALLAGTLACLPLGAAAAEAAPSPAVRRAMLDSIRPAAAKRVGQPVKFKVERLNLDGNWALLTGELVSATAGPLDWDKAKECHPELDKMLWAVLEKKGGRWHLKHLEVCATEPPHWTLEQFGGFAWPCGVYAGLQGPTGEDLQTACQSQSANKTPRRR